MTPELFDEILERYEAEGGVFSAEDCVACIELARRAMLDGAVSVEGYYKAKEILLSKLQCESEVEN